MYLIPLLFLAILNYQDQSPLASWKWKNRILILHHQEDLFQTLNSKVKELNERDLIIIHIENDKISFLPIHLKLDSKVVSNFFGLKRNDSKVILIGKDGGIKLNKPLASHNEIFDLIDSMPMRQSEMRKKSGR